MIIDCAVDFSGWGDVEALETISQRAIQATIEQIDPLDFEEAEVSLLFTRDDHVQQLNRQWRDQDKPTNVLSFAANESEGPATPILGDIVLARETILNEAKQQNKVLTDHLTHLIIHGFLHLLGHDHQEDGEARIMEKLETDILAGLGIADPYA